MTQEQFDKIQIESRKLMKAEIALCINKIRSIKTKFSIDTINRSLRIEHDLEKSKQNKRTHEYYKVRAYIQKRLIEMNSLNYLDNTNPLIRFDETENGLQLVINMPKKIE